MPGDLEQSGGPESWGHLEHPYNVAPTADAPVQDGAFGILCAVLNILGGAFGCLAVAAAALGRPALSVGHGRHELLLVVLLQSLGAVLAGRKHAQKNWESAISFSCITSWRENLSSMCPAGQALPWRPADLAGRFDKPCLARPGPSPVGWLGGKAWKMVPKSWTAVLRLGLSW